MKLRGRFLLLLLVGLLFAAAPGRAEVDIPWQWIHQQGIDETVKKLDALLGPFRASAGFPDLAGKDWATVYRRATAASGEAAALMDQLIAKMRFPLKIELGARYLRARFAIGSRYQLGVAHTEEANEFLCREFGRLCDLGFKEIQLWASAEPIFTMENLWTRTIVDGLGRARAMLPTLPATVPPAQAREIWRKAATAAVAASNEIGLTASRVGGFQFPAWRLRYAVKYFKAAIKDAVIDWWDATPRDPAAWVTACDRLRACVEGLPAGFDALIRTLPR